MMGSAIVNFPIPWFDFNATLHTFMRGACFGVATDILAFTGGLIIPFRVIVSMLIGGLCIQFIGNWLAVEYLTKKLTYINANGVEVTENIPMFNRFVEGMSIKTTLVNQVMVWASVFIGGMVAAGLIKIFANPKELVNTFKGLKKVANIAKDGDETVNDGEKLPSLKLLMILFFGSIVAFALLYKLLIPDFPLFIILPFAVIWSFVFSLIDIRAKGDTGFKIDPPYVREGLIISINKMQGISPQVWFAPWPVSLNAQSFVEYFKVADLVKCRPMDYLKAIVLAYPAGFIANFIFISIFWAMAPIPSANYPFASAQLPVVVQNLCIWMSTTAGSSKGLMAAQANAALNPYIMIGTFLVFLMIYIIPQVIKPLKKFELSLIGLAVGMAAPLPMTISLFIGAITFKIIAWRIGKDWFKENKNIIVAGLAVGEGVVIGIFASIAALISSLVNLPY